MAVAPAFLLPKSFLEPRKASLLSESMLSMPKRNYKAAAKMRRQVVRRERRYINQEMCENNLATKCLCKIFTEMLLP